MRKAKRHIALLLCFLMVLSGAMPVFASASTISDVKGHWAETSIQSAVESGLINGYLDGTFKPNNTISRAEFFTLVNRAYGFTKRTAVTYGDVPSSMWYAEEIQKAEAAGYIDVEVGGLVEPIRAITREEAAAIIAKVEKLHAISLEQAFNDDDQAADENQNAIIAVGEAQIMTGYPNGDFKPKGNITRAEAIVTLTKAMAHKSMENYVYYEAKTYGEEASKTVVDGNVIVTKSGAKLRNLVINGNLTIGSQVGDGEVYLEDVDIKGATLVYGGGVNSIYLDDVKMNTVYVDKARTAVRLVASGDTAIENLVVRSKVEIREQNLIGDAKGFDKMLVEKVVPGGKEVDITLLSGNFSKIDLKGQNVDLIVSTAAKISKLNVEGQSSRILGKGIITTATVNASGVTFDQRPTNLHVATGITTPTIKTASTGTSSGGSGSSSSSSSSGGSSGGSTTVLINTPTALKNAIESSSNTTVTLQGSITGDVVAARTASGSLTINFNGYSINGDLDLTANNATSITLNSTASEQISGDFLVDARNASVTNNVTVAGKAVLENVAYNSYDANKSHGKGIDVRGRAKVKVAATVSNAIINIQSYFPVILEGTIGEVNLESAGASAIVKATVNKINIRKGAKNAQVQMAGNATLAIIKADEVVKLLAENLNILDIIIDTTGVAQVEKKVAHLVTFGENGGDFPPAPPFKYVESGLALGALPSTPIRDGYVFTGWNTAMDGSGSVVTESTVISEAGTFYAQWQAVLANTYMVMFESNGGTAVSPISGIAANGTITLPTNPTRTGYTFAGWFIDDGSFATEFTASSQVTSDMTVYAKWVKISYTVYFESNGGSAVSDVTLSAGNNLTMPTDPTRTGYTFAGWYKDYNLSEAFTASTSITSDMTLYAKWLSDSETTYTITFESNGGSVIAPIEVYEGTAPAMPSEPTKTGYAFGGWYVDDALTTKFTATSTISSDMTLYAMWDLASYKLTFDPNNGTVETSTTVTAGGTVVMPSDPVRQGYIFAGWYQDVSFETAFTASTQVTHDMWLIAKWTAVQPTMYTVTFETNGGNVISAIQVAEGDVPNMPSDPTLLDHTFAGWYYDLALTTPFSSSAVITSDMTLYAKWLSNVPDTFTVTFESNGGSVVNPIQVEDGQAPTMPSDPTKTGYTFVGWYMDTELTTPVSMDLVITGDITVYAKWAVESANTYTVTFEENGGLPVDNIVNVTAGATVVLPTTVRSGYTFEGWFTAGDIAFTESTAVNSDITLYAKWLADVVTYTVTFDENGGLAVSDVTNVTSGATIVLPTTSNPTYTFAGWYKTEKYLTEFTSSTPVDDDTLLHACWTTPGATYTVTFMDETTPAGTVVTTSGGTVTLPAAPVRDGFTFMGWYVTTGDVYEQLDESSKIYIDLTVYSKWQ